MFKRIFILQGKTIQENKAFLQNISDEINCVEFRVDYLSEMNLEEIRDFLRVLPYPVIITLRSISNRGQFKGSEAERLSLLQSLAELNPDYIDIESHVDIQFIEALKAKFQSLQIIRSYHDHESTPTDLPAIYHEIDHPAVTFVKIITTAQTTLDALRILQFIKAFGNEKKLISHAMGDKGIFTRLLGLILGSQACYITASNVATPAPGCFNLKMAFEVYGIHRLKSDTKVYGLIGSPVAQSVGIYFHNEFFQRNNINALYVNCELIKSEVSIFLDLLKGLPFYGFSITTPMKEVMARVSDNPDPVVKLTGFCNTWRLRDGQWDAFHTDGEGCWEAIARQGGLPQSAFIIGSGATATNIAWVARERGVKAVTFVSRSPEKGKAVAAKTDAAWISLDDDKLASLNCDVIIFTLPPKVELSEKFINLLNQNITSKTRMMDVNYYLPLEQQYGALFPIATNIEGKQMFVYQAEAQQAIWARVNS